MHQVYHQECLGFEVPDDDTDWTCPRHHCRDCMAWAKHVCRYCPTSFCGRVRLAACCLGTGSLGLTVACGCLLWQHYGKQSAAGETFHAKGGPSPFLKPGIGEFVCITCVRARDEALSRALMAASPHVTH